MIRILPATRLLGVSIPFLDGVGCPTVGQHCGRSTPLLHSSRTPAPRMTRSGVPRPSHSAGGGRVGGQSNYLSYLATSPNPTAGRPTNDVASAGCGERCCMIARGWRWFLLVLILAGYGVLIARVSYGLIYGKLLWGQRLTGLEVDFMLPGAILVAPLFPGPHSGAGFFPGVVICNTIAWLLLGVGLMMVVRLVLPTLIRWRRQRIGTR